jgi:hypothetical protein
MLAAAVRTVRRWPAQRTAGTAPLPRSPRVPWPDSPARSRPTRQAIREDTTEGRERPRWLLSCYGHERGGVNDLQGDVSFEEARWANQQVSGPRRSLTRALLPSPFRLNHSGRGAAEEPRKQRGGWGGWQALLERGGLAAPRGLVTWPWACAGAARRARALGRERRVARCAAGQGGRPGGADGGTAQRGGGAVLLPRAQAQVEREGGCAGAAGAHARACGGVWSVDGRPAPESWGPSWKAGLRR